MKVRSIQLASGVAVFALMACSPPDTGPVAPILLFSGIGASVNDVRAIEAILKQRHLEYVKADSERLNGMSTSQLTAHQLLIVPGGNYITMGNGLTPGAAGRVHDAVQGGLNYLGICAGGLLAGKAGSNSFDLASGVRFGFYAAVNQGSHKAPVTIAGADAVAIEHYWEDGPEFTGWGDVVGKYPDGTPGIVEGMSGKGWVILCGVHPEAPENWRKGMTFTTTANSANAYAGTLVEAALRRTPLPHF